MRTLPMLLFCAASLLAQRTLRVGPGQEYPTLAALPKPIGGDVVEISPGVYFETKRWIATNTEAQPIVIRGVGAKPLIDGMGNTGRGIFQFEGGVWILENVQFRNAHNGSLNHSGIRNVSAALTVRNVKVWSCDMGIFSSNGAVETIVEDSDIGWNGRGALAHNFYIDGQRIVLLRNHIHHSLGGQNVKVRARLAEVKGNYIHDGKDGEVEFVQGAHTLVPGANALMEGNMIASLGARLDGNCCRFINFGHEGDPAKDRLGTLTMRNNVMIARNSKQIFVTLASLNAALVSVGNSYLGSANLLRDRYGSKGVTSLNDFNALTGFPTAARFVAAPAILPAPSGVAVAFSSNGKNLLVTWAPAPGAAYYRIYRQRTDTAGVVGTLRIVGGSVEPEHRDQPDTVTGTFSYRVSSVNSEDVEGAMSDPISIVKF